MRTGSRETKKSKIYPISPGLLGPAIAVLAAFVVGAVLIRMAGANPIQAYVALFRGAFGSVRGFSETVVKATPLALAGLGVAVAFKCSVWNLGAEGQLLMGAIGATGVGLAFSELPAPVLLPLTLLTAFAAGGLWGAIVGALRAWFNANELVVTLMMNYIAIFLVNYLVSGPWRDPSIAEPQTAMISVNAQLPRLISSGRMHAGALVAIVCAVMTYILLFRTSIGYKIRVTGANAKAARYGGINVEMIVIIAMMISGGLAALAGMGEVAGVHLRLMDGISSGYGYTAIVVALLGRLHPGGVVLAALLFGGLLVGADAMQRVAAVPASLVQVIIGLILLFVLGGDFLINRKG